MAEQRATGGGVGTGTGSTWSVRRPDGTVAPGWYLVPLRAFLGVTFLYAGLQKLANPDFFHNASPVSIHAQLEGATHGSPIHALLTHLLPIADAVGLLIALGEVAIGLGVLVGLLTRVAAVGGIALSFGLFLTVSFHSSPYFTGADIVFVFAWTPLALAGAAGAPALDTWLATRRADGAPATRSGAVSRRAVVSTGAVAGVVAGGAVVLAAADAVIGRAAGGTSGQSATAATLPTGGTTASTGTTSPPTTASGGTTPSTSAAEPKGTAIGPAADVPVGGSAAFTDPKSGDPSLVIHPTADRFVAFDAICPHAGCTVAYDPSIRRIACPCHGSQFNAETGAVLQGPATYGLTALKIAEGGDGKLYVAD